MTTVFISYSSQDKEFAERLETELKREGFIPSRDANFLRAGDEWWRKIETEIKACAGLVVIMTPESIQSTYVEREILLAEHESKHVIPLSIDNAKWSLLAHLQYYKVLSGELPQEDFYKRIAEYAPRYKVSSAAPAWIMRLISLMNDTDREIEVGATSALITIGESAVPFLIDALDSDSSAERVSSMDALSGIGVKAVPLLTKALTDDRRSVSTRAAKVLGRIRDTRAIEPLVNALGSYGVRVDAAGALGKIGIRALDKLVEALNSQDELVVLGACWALTDIGDSQAIPYLEALRKRTNNPNLINGLSKAIEELMRHSNEAQ